MNNMSPKGFNKWFKIWYEQDSAPFHRARNNNCQVIENLEIDILRISGGCIYELPKFLVSIDIQSQNHRNIYQKKIKDGIKQQIFRKASLCAKFLVPYSAVEINGDGSPETNMLSKSASSKSNS